MKNKNTHLILHQHISTNTFHFFSIVSNFLSPRLPTKCRPCPIGTRLQDGLTCLQEIRPDHLKGNFTFLDHGHFHHPESDFCENISEYFRHRKFVVELQVTGFWKGHEQVVSRLLETWILKNHKLTVTGDLKTIRFLASGSLWIFSSDPSSSPARSAGVPSKLRF